MFMLTGVVILLATLHHTSAAQRTRQYECGAHGRFEYCIDGFPGCVIGCHCYPGYYFDTDTKICESNSKLIQQYRRLIPHVPDPVEPTHPPTNPPISAQNVLTKKIEKNSTEDLSDWLYNQFFKTVENQVINKTDGPVQIPSRRSGSRHTKRKKISRSTSKRRKDKNDLRRKLLRITEDDSLFESSSGGSSESSDSASDSSDDSSEYDRSRGHKGEHYHHPDGPHEYKQFMIINKKPKPPLPSFIFLPNMDTPYYPPLGLPPPVPMYPMVPVPPVLPMFPFQDKDCTNASKPETTTNAATISTNSATTNSTKDPTPAPPPTPPPPPPPTPPPPPPPTPPPPPPGQSAVEDGKNSTMRKHLRKSRNKLLKQLRERQKLLRQKASKANIPIPTSNDHPDLSSMYNEMLKSNPFDENSFNDFEGPVLESPANSLPEDTTNNIDFKYLSQLIHRNDPKAPNNFPHPESPYGDLPPVSSINEQPGSPQLPPSLNPPEPPSRRLNNPNDPRNDKFFTNLGREIASLIRNIDKKGEREINMEIESIAHRDLPAPLFNDNTYGSHSYWERSVRSPFQTKMSQYRSISKPNIHNSRETLLDLEDEVFVAASTEPSLNLIELEDIINFIESAKSMKVENPKQPKQTSRSLNISLMPKVKQQATVNLEPKLQQPPLVLNPRLPGLALKQRPPGSGLKQRPPGLALNQRPPGLALKQRPPGLALNQRPPGLALKQRPPGLALKQRPPGLALKQRPPGLALKQRPPGLALKPVSTQQRQQPLIPTAKQHTYNEPVQGDTVKPQTYYIQRDLLSRRNKIGSHDGFVGLQKTNTSRPPSRDWRFPQKSPARDDIHLVLDKSIKLPKTTTNNQILTKPFLLQPKSHHQIDVKPRRQPHAQSYPFIPVRRTSTVMPQSLRVNPLVLRGLPQLSPNKVSLTRRRVSSKITGSNVGFAAGPYPYPSYFHRGDTHHFDYFD